MLQFFVFIMVMEGCSFAQQMEIMWDYYGHEEPEVVNLRAATPDWGNFTQKLDHYNPYDDRTWVMRYLNNSQFFQEGGPIFIYLGGEWTISPSSLMTGQIFDLASDHNGYMFYTEHRYYGQSFPTEDYSTENLRYLVTDQALEDVANFIEYQKSLDMFKNSQIVVIGGSYSATMATWMRLKYPHLVDIAYSSCAPLAAVVDYYEYLEVVNDAINATDPDCLDTIREAIVEVESYLVTDDGINELKQVFRLCDDTTDLNDYQNRAHFFGSFTWSWSGIIQYAQENDIQNYCNILKEANGSAIEKMNTFLGAYLNNNNYCLGNYATSITTFNGSSLTTSATRQWTYQTCTEYGFYQTTASNGQPFGKNLLMDYYYQRCQDMFGEQVNKDILYSGANRTNMLYGHVLPEISYVVSTHGSIDPWHRAGILEDVNDLAPVFIVEGAAHCQDLRSANAETDSPEMYETKMKVREIIREWLKKRAAGDGSDGNDGDGSGDGNNGGGSGGSNGISSNLLTFAIVLLASKIIKLL